MDENERAKRGFISAFFDNASRRVDFLMDLNAQGHDTEALTLCLTYIDSFAQWLLWPRAQVGRNFADAVIQFGGDPMMALVHPVQAVRAFERMNGPWPNIARRIEQAYPGPAYQLLTYSAFEQGLQGHLTKDQVDQVRGEQWRLTFAGLAYQHLRNPSVHSFGASAVTTFSATTYNGQPVPPLNLQSLAHVLRGLVAEARRRSEATGQWFGNDSILG